MTDTYIDSPSAPDSVNPESLPAFRWARMLVLFSVAAQDSKTIDSVDRLAFYEFFADSPWVVVGGDTKQDIADQQSLKVVGFSRTQLSYASTGARFASRRQRIQTDLAQLVALGLIAPHSGTFKITELGVQTAAGMHSSYADAYRASSSIVLRRLGRMRNAALTRAVEGWLGRSWLLLDLLDDVRGAELPPPPPSAPPTEPTPPAAPLTPAPAVALVARVAESDY